jgi:hypothetical protein
MLVFDEPNWFSGERLVLYKEDNNQTPLNCMNIVLIPIFTCLLTVGVISFFWNNKVKGLIFSDACRAGFASCSDYLCNCLFMFKQYCVIVRVRGQHKLDPSDSNLN